MSENLRCEVMLVSCCGFVNVRRALLGGILEKELCLLPFHKLGRAPLQYQFTNQLQRSGSYNGKLQRKGAH